MITIKKGIIDYIDSNSNRATREMGPNKYWNDKPISFKSLNIFYHIRYIKGYCLCKYMNAKRDMWEKIYINMMAYLLKTQPSDTLDRMNERYKHNFREEKAIHPSMRSMYYEQLRYAYGDDMRITGNEIFEKAFEYKGK